MDGDDQRLYLIFLRKSTTLTMTNTILQRQETTDWCET